jgi:hypothetical protein
MRQLHDELSASGAFTGSRYHEHAEVVLRRKETNGSHATRV